MTRWIRVDTDPADDPCQYPVAHPLGGTYPCALPVKEHWEHAGGHPFTAPRTLTAEDVALVLDGPYGNECDHDPAAILAALTEAPDAT